MAELNRRYLGAIQGKLAADHAKDDSDAELERVLSPCVRGGFLVPAARLLRDEGYSLVLAKPSKEQK